MSRSSRRQFLKQTAIGFPAIVGAAALGRGGAVAASERIVIGCIGVGGQGGSNMRAFLSKAGAQVVAVCDVDSSRKVDAKNHVNGHYDNKDCADYLDYGEILARDDIDAVSIGSPDHWHSVMVCDAARAGKDMYCEKPISLTVADGRAMVDIVTKKGRVLQTGTWRRSRPPVRTACELIHNGRIGTLHTIHIGLPIGFALRHDATGENTPPQEIPNGFDYDRWLGPAPWAPYAKDRCHFNFRWLLDYSEGYISDWGAHYYDVGQWGNGTDLTGPISVEGTAKFPEDGLYDAPSDSDLVFTYANGVKMVSTQTDDQSVWGMKFEGDEGWIKTESNTLEASDPAILEPLDGNAKRLYTSDDHHQNFLDCVKSRETTAAPIEVAHRSASICHIGTICALVGRSLKWDPETERFPDDPQANRLLSRSMRAPYKL